MKKSPILEAIDQICQEKHIARESVLATIEAALAVAYRKDFADKKNQNIVAEFNPETAAARIFDVKEVVEDALFEEYERQREEAERLRAEQEAAGVTASVHPAFAAPAVPETSAQAAGAGETPPGNEKEEGEEKVRRFDPKSMLPLKEALASKPDAAVGDIIKTELFPPNEYGRMAAQTAKQVIIQRLREAEREMTFNEFKGRVGEILTGTVQRVEGRVVLVDLGHSTAVIPPAEQIERERYLPGSRIKVYVVSVNQTTRGPEIVVSRSHPDMVRKLFTQEVPEVASGAITIKGIAREAGSRTKIAVHTTEPNIDPVGSCVGQRGTRVQTIIAELGGEKIDIIQYEEDPVRFIMSALSPAKILSVILREHERRAIAEVKEDQLSFAIGRAGQNVRLAARLTGWKIDIVRENAPATPEASAEETALEPAADGIPPAASDAAPAAETPMEPAANEAPAKPDAASPNDPAPAETPAVAYAPATENAPVADEPTAAKNETGDAASSAADGATKATE